MTWRGTKLFLRKKGSNRAMVGSYLQTRVWHGHEGAALCRDDKNKGRGDSILWFSKFFLSYGGGVKEVLKRGRSCLCSK